MSKDQALSFISCSSSKKPIAKWQTLGAACGFALGILVIMLAGLSFLTNMQLEDILAWVGKNFGVTFSLLFAVLVLLAIYSIIKIKRLQNTPLWCQVGSQAANGISTLALTFTLLGISLGIGSLAEQSLSPDNISKVIGVLTNQFSMAFMTTVVGLPTATLLRAWIAILVTKQSS